MVGAQVCVIGTTPSATRAATGSTTLGIRLAVEVIVICPKVQPRGAAVPSIVIASRRLPPAGTENELGDTVTFRPFAPVVVTLNGWSLVVTFCSVR